MKILIVTSLLSLVGASTSNVGYVSHHVDLVISNENGVTIPGSGVIISLNHILTIALNLNGFTRWKIIFGNKHIGHKSVISETAIIHPDYDPVAMRNNVGIISLPESLPVTPASFPVGLPVFIDDLPKIGDFGLVASYHDYYNYYNDWSNLTYGSHRVLEDSKCNDILPKFKEQKSYFCATQEFFKVCGGSQGTGFVQENNGQRIVLGLLAFGDFWGKCANLNRVLYVRVAPHVYWIRQNTT